MKKIITTILLVLSIASTSNAGPFVKFEAGPSLNVENVYFTEAIIGYKLKLWEIESQTYGGWLTWSEYGSQCKPFMEIYSINQKFIYNHTFIHFQHYCAHRVENIDTTFKHYNEKGEYQYTSYKPSPYWWAGRNTTISIGFEYEWK